MRSPYILLGLLVRLTAATNGRRVAESRPSSQAVEEDYDETIRSLKLSSTERKEVFGDTSELILPLQQRNDSWYGFSYHQTIKSYRLSFIHFTTARGEM